MNGTSIVGAEPQVTAPIRAEGQANSELLFEWLRVKRKLWMLEDPDHLERLGTHVGLNAAVRIMRRFFAWKQANDDGHLFLQPPDQQVDIDAAFDYLDRLLKAHFFGDEEG